MDPKESMLPINPMALGKPRGYSNGMLAPAGARLLFIAGQIAWDEAQTIVCDDFRGQFAQALNNVLTVVREAGGGPESIGSLTLYVTDKQEYLACLKELGETYRLAMGRHFPTMALVEVSALLEPRAKVEIQGMAVITAEPSLTLAESTGTDDSEGDKVTEFPTVVPDP